jgi:hydrogenase maturation protease
VDAVTARIIGLGNRLRCDDAVGPLVAERLASGELPAGVEVVESGGDPFILLDLIAGCGRAVIVDAAEMGCEPGTVKVLRNDEIPAVFRMHTSLHAVDLQDVLAMARKMGVTTKVSLVAVQVGDCGYSETLSPAVEKMFTEITNIALKEAVNEA